MSDANLAVDGLTECLVDTHNSIVRNAKDIFPFDAELTICEKISNALEVVHGEEILNRLDS